MTAPDYFPEDYDRVDYCNVTTADDLRPFLAHVLGPMTATERTEFLAGVARIADAMARDQAAHNLTGTQFVMLETARLNGAVTVASRHWPTAVALANTGLVTLEHAGEGTTVTPVKQP